MAELIITIKKDEKKWPATSKRTRITGYGEGVHSMTSEHWEARLKHVNNEPRIIAAMKRGDIEIMTSPPVVEDTDEQESLDDELELDESPELDGES